METEYAGDRSLLIHFYLHELGLAMLERLYFVQLIGKWQIQLLLTETIAVHLNLEDARWEK